MEDQMSLSEPYRYWTLTGIGGPKRDSGIEEGINSVLGFIEGVLINSSETGLLASQHDGTCDRLQPEIVPTGCTDPVGPFFHLGDTGEVAHLPKVLDSG